MFTPPLPDRRVPTQFNLSVLANSSRLYLRIEDSILLVAIHVVENAIASERAVRLCLIKTSTITPWNNFITVVMLHQTIARYPSYY